MNPSASAFDSGPYTPPPARAPTDASAYQPSAPPGQPDFGIGLGPPGQPAQQPGAYGSQQIQPGETIDGAAAEGHLLSQAQMDEWKARVEGTASGFGETESGMPSAYNPQL